MLHRSDNCNFINSIFFQTDVAILLLDMSINIYIFWSQFFFSLLCPSLLFWRGVIRRKILYFVKNIFCKTYPTAFTDSQDSGCVNFSRKKSSLAQTDATYSKQASLFLKILLTHEGSHREVYRDFQPSLTSSAGGAKGCSDHRLRAPPAYTAQLPTLLCINTEPTTSIGRLIKSSRLYGLAAALRQHLNLSLIHI